MNGQATYGFLPWLRRGVSTEIERVDGNGPEAPRARFPVTLIFNNGTPDEQATAHLVLSGPGEVAAINQRMIIRTDPRPDVFDAESNYFPLIEFDQPDFPWRYTPASATAQDRLRPWLALIVLADDEGIYTPADPVHGMLPKIAVPDDLLPDLSQSWAWAHVQITGLDRASAANADEIARIDREEPRRTLSRLLCARHLKPRTAYTAYLVPTFERGRLAGLNQEINDAVDALAPAWSMGDAETVVLPVYHQWRFGTAEEGNFESLVRELLPPRVLSDQVGRRTMDASNPGAGLPPATRTGGAPLTMEGAMMSPACRDTSPEWTNRQPFVDQLEQLLNTPTDLVESGTGQTAVAPALYGRWHASRTRLQWDSAPSWFDELNGDPQLRAIAGLGTRVVQEHQEQLMAAAWEQVEGVLAANKQLREAELGCAVATRLVERDLLQLGPEAVLQITAPILARIMASPRTILATLRDSPIAGGALQAQFRQLTRPLGHIGRKQARTSERRGRFGVRPGQTGAILQRMNRGELSLPPPAAGARLPSIKNVAARLAPSRPAWWRYLPAALALIAIALLVFAMLIPSAPIAVIVATFGVAAAAGAWIANRAERRRNVLVGLSAGTLSASDVLRAPAARGFQPHEIGFDNSAAGATVPAPQSAANFQIALSKLTERLASAQAEPAPKPAADFAHLHETIMEAIRPERAIVAGIGPRVHLRTGVDRDPENCGPIMAAPTFKPPMYEPLRDLSKEWLLPGVGEIPPNTVSLVVTNQRFVESYMLGLNHEMARELLWREYPTDQRGTYFRQFWDVRGYAGPPGTELRDIEPIHQWASATPLGTHHSATPRPEDQLVLLIRGRLLHRYPNTIIYAVRGTLPGAVPVAQGGLRELGTDERHPLFFGTLEPDVAFVGFDLTQPEVVGDDNSVDSEDQGWFFVFQEQPGAPRFGLDVTAGPLGAAVVEDPNYAGADRLKGAWASLSWGHLVRTIAELESMTYIDLDSTLRYPGDDQLPLTPDAPLDEPQLAWHAAAGSRSSDLAYITLRRPFRVSVHGSDMLP